MNKREIVIETLGHKRCEVIPHNIDFTTAMREKLREHFGLASTKDVSEAGGNYCVQLNVGSVTGPSDGVIDEIYPKQIGPHTYRDDWGVIWRREPGDDIGVVIDPPLKEPSLVCRLFLYRLPANGCQVTLANTSIVRTPAGLKVSGSGNGQDHTVL